MILLITVVGLLTLYFADKNIFNKILESFKKPKDKLYTDKEIKENGYLAIDEVFYEIPKGCAVVFLLIIIIFIVILCKS